jgi:hypothetical protein
MDKYSMISVIKIITYVYTIKHLKFKQIFYRIYYFFYNKRKWNITLLDIKSYPVKMQDSIISYTSYLGNNTFFFLNKKHRFNEDINWNFQEYGNLWAYNLNYFEFLHQPNLSKQEGLALIHNFIDRKSALHIGFAPYPISLRNIFWIRFLTKYSIQNKRIDSFLYATYKLLSRHLEYHLLGNHLLENAFSLLFGAYYFQDEKLYCKAKKILKKELQEQILKDGAHFELSPMYHSIMLYRVLDCYNLVINNVIFGYELKDLLRENGEKMLAWLNKMTFRNGDIPLVNDAAFGIAPTPQQLNEYAFRLGINCNEAIALKESGYRKCKNEKFEIIVDIGNICPDYQPGHAHADTFNFILYINKRPVIIDTGTSTYEINDTRFYERGTAAHNTIVLSDKNSSEVWSGHRVAKRAKVKILEDSKSKITAMHNGYSSPHYRNFSFDADQIKIVDSIDGKGVAYFHFHSNEQVAVNGSTINGRDFCMEFINYKKLELIDTHISTNFNLTKLNKTLKIEFYKRLETYIR